MRSQAQLFLIFGLVQIIQAELCFEMRDKMALFLNNDKVYRHVSLEECKDLCAQETTFSCMSFDHTNSQTCYLSKTNHESVPNMLGQHETAVYGFVIPCDDEADGGSGSGSGSGEAEEEEETNAMRFRFFAGEGRSRRRRETDHVLPVDLKTLVDKSGRRKLADLE